MSVYDATVHLIKDGKEVKLLTVEAYNGIYEVKKLKTKKLDFDSIVLCIDSDYNEEGTKCKYCSSKNNSETSSVEESSSEDESKRFEGLSYLPKVPDLKKRKLNE